MKKNKIYFGDFLYEYFCEINGFRFRIVSDDLFLKEVSFFRGRNFRVSEESPASAPVKFMKEYLQNYFSGESDEKFSVIFRFNYKDIMVRKGVSPVGSIVLDMEGFTEKEVNVYRELVKVGSGKTISYGELAARCGIPGGGRFTGNTMAKNRFPVIIPCHRVIRSDGSMGLFSGGEEIKEKLLRHESASVNLS
ncbi:MAG TPA: MGMT family protein [Spirochaetota bacterium]|nr:MGMT family protein [Spirochaetota bacterium]HPJ33231.1 MGMT family protein [Spirochaetota bacterium]